MKITELNKIAEENEYKLNNDYLRLRFKREVECGVNKIDINTCYNTLWISNPLYCDEKDLNMIKASMKFCETPLKDREAEKYFYKHNSMKTKGGNPTYLAIRQRPSISYPVLQGSSEDIFEYKVEFTDEEIQMYQDIFNISLDNFIKMEVCEVEE